MDPVFVDPVLVDPVVAVDGVVGSSLDLLGAPVGLGSLGPPFRGSTVPRHCLMGQCRKRRAALHLAISLEWALRSDCGVRRSSVLFDRLGLAICSNANETRWFAETGCSSP